MNSIKDIRKKLGLKYIVATLVGAAISYVLYPVCNQPTNVKIEDINRDSIEDIVVRSDKDGFPIYFIGQPNKTYERGRLVGNNGHSYIATDNGSAYRNNGFSWEKFK